MLRRILAELAFALALLLALYVGLVLQFIG